ncbi:uncharacterized protein LOC126348871 [Schistocerca gregaria]|uniref:uncharacterized protein LOC126348871 n=1 Tax=Schistocerca gregaria TaxID=7010 RepID=UPI00211E0B2B|nr:uncharacterized protein LOC126348871 [Schistocerca gregaria]
MAELSLKKSAVLVVMAAAVALAIPTEDKKAATDVSQSGVTLPFSTSGDNYRTFINVPTCRPGLCPFIKKLVPDHHPHPDSPHNPAPSVCGNMCSADVTCPIGQRCCPTHCGYVCHPIVVVAPPNA